MDSYTMNDKDKVIEAIAEGIYSSNGYARSWADAVDWIGLERFSKPAQDVLKCRHQAQSTYAAIEAAGYSVVKNVAPDVVGEMRKRADAMMPGVFKKTAP